MVPERLTSLENIIANNQHRFFDIGKALKEIRDARLYKLTLFETFEAYAKNRWDMARSQVYRLIDAYNVVNNLSPNGTFFLEMRPRHVSWRHWILLSNVKHGKNF